MGFADRIIPALAAVAVFFLLPGCKADGPDEGPDEEEIDTSYTPQEVRAALVDIYDATSGASWTKSTNWCSDSPVSDWYGISTDSEGNVTRIELGDNNLKGKLPDVFDRFPKLKTLRLSSNTLSGQLPQTLRRIKTEGFTAYLANNSFETTTFKVPNDRIEEVSLAMHVYPSDNPAFQFFVDSRNDGKGKYHSDGEVQVIHKAEEGKGFDLVIIGDGFDKDENTVGGTAEYWLTLGAQAHFDIDPMQKLYKYFNVYVIYNYSPVKGVSLGSNKVNSRFHYTQSNLSQVGVTFDFSSCNKFIQSALGRSVGDNAVICIAPNCTQNSMIGGVEYRKSGTAYAFCPTRASAFRELVKHESTGHGIGHLIDEYSGSEVYTPKDPDDPSKDNPVKDYANADIESDPAKVKWAQFIADERYQNEDLGVFEGCYKYKSGVYRPSQKSMMNGSSLRNNFFNAPSRANIYSWVMKTAYGEDNFKYDFEAFAKWDKGL